MSHIRLHRSSRLPATIGLFTLLLAIACGPSDGASEMLGAGAGGTAGSADGGGGGDAAEGGAGSNGAGGQEGAPPRADVDADGFFNNPVESLAADPVDGPLGAFSDAQSIGDYVEAAAACYAEPTACDRPDCAAFASCCPASGRCCSRAEDSLLPAAIDFTSCAGLSLQACAADQGFEAQAFGPDSRVLTERGIVPNGSATAEGGALIGGPVDLSSKRVRIETQLAPPVGCNAVCLQSAGIAFTPASELGGFAGTAVGLLLSGARDAVQLVIRSQVAATFDAGNADTVWALTVSPSGMVEVERDGAVVERADVDAASLDESHLAVFGRNLEADDESAAVSRIATDVELCDNPSRWIERTPISVTVAGDLDPELTTSTQPSIATGSQGTIVAFERDGAIFLGDAQSPSIVALGSDVPHIAPTEAFEAGGIGEPELFWFDGSLHVLYTAYDPRGIGTIGSAIIDGDLAQKTLEPVLDVPGDAVSLDSPTVVARDDLVLMVLRATLRSGGTELRAYYSSDPQSSWVRVLDGTLEDLTRVDSAASSIDSPSLIVHNSAYHLYYARRNGTRWAIELATSDELLLWRRIGEVLGASGEGFDSLGARGPDARSLFDRVELVYMGQDGVSFRLGRALREAPSTTAF